MGVQTRILKRTVAQTITYIDANGQTVTKTLTSGTGALIGGIPGKIFSVAYGPVVHAISLAADNEIGGYVAGQGVIVNAPEYALVGGLAPSLAVKAGTVVSCMTAGQVWVTKAKAEEILAAMNGYIVFETGNPPFDPDDSDASDSGADDPNALCVIEVNGFKAA